MKKTGVVPAPSDDRPVAGLKAEDGLPPPVVVPVRWALDGSRPIAIDDDPRWHNRTPRRARRSATADGERAAGAQGGERPPGAEEDGQGGDAE